MMCIHATIACNGKAISTTHSECVFVALGFQHAMCMQHFHLCPVQFHNYFSTLSYKWHNV